MKFKRIKIKDGKTNTKKNENWEKRTRLGTKKMRYFKIPLCRNFLLKIRDQLRPNGVRMQSQTTRVSDVLGQKLGYDTQIAEKVVAEFVAVHFVHCPLSTLVKWLLTRYASDVHCFWWPLLLMTCLQELFFRPVASNAVLQTHFLRGFKLQINFLCSMTCSIRISMNSTLIMILYTWTNV